MSHGWTVSGGHGVSIMKNGMSVTNGMTLTVNRCRRRTDARFYSVGWWYGYCLWRGSYRRWWFKHHDAITVNTGVLNIRNGLTLVNTGLVVTSPVQHHLLIK